TFSGTTNRSAPPPQHHPEPGNRTDNSSNYRHAPLQIKPSSSAANQRNTQSRYYQRIQFQRAKPTAI
ncbi:MAG: hypothetical protein ACI4X9_03015, partial [Kiritimatiellia bacterium]